MFSLMHSFWRSVFIVLAVRPSCPGAFSPGTCFIVSRSSFVVNGATTGFHLSFGMCSFGELYMDWNHFPLGPSSLVSGGNVGVSRKIFSACFRVSVFICSGSVISTRISLSSSILTLLCIVRMEVLGFFFFSVLSKSSLIFP